MLTDPFTGDPSIAFTLYAIECDKEDRDEDEEEDDSPLEDWLIFYKNYYIIFIES